MRADACRAAPGTTCAAPSRGTREGGSGLVLISCYVATGIGVGVFHGVRSASMAASRAELDDEQRSRASRLFLVRTDILRLDAEFPRARSKSPRVRSKFPRARSKSPRARSKSPRARSKSPRARSKSPRARAKFTPARSKFPQGSVDQEHRQSKLPLAARNLPRTCSICGVCCVGWGGSGNINSFKGYVIKKVRAR